MKLEEAKEEFIQAWGALGSSWGINRTMSSIHALLMANNEPLSTEDIMAALQISRGNANMNTRALIEWGLVKKHRIAGDRKEFFVAGKDVWEMARQIAKERRKRELNPVIESLEKLKDIEENSEEAESFKKRINDLHDFTSEISGLVDKFTRNDRNWFYRSLLKLLGWYFFNPLLSFISENNIIMSIILITYGLYLIFTAIIILKVGWLIYREGAVYLYELFPAEQDLAQYLNRLLLIGYYLLNLGYASVSLIAWQWPLENDWQYALISLAENIGLIALLLGLIHFFNLIGLQVLKHFKSNI